MNRPTPRDYADQVLLEIAAYPEKNRDKACSDCGTFPPFRPVRFTWDDGTGLPILEAKEDHSGWTTWSVIGTGVDWKRACPPCARKRGMT